MMKQIHTLPEVLRHGIGGVAMLRWITINVVDLGNARDLGRRYKRTRLEGSGHRSLVDREVLVRGIEGKEVYRISISRIKSGHARGMKQKSRGSRKWNGSATAEIEGMTIEVQVAD